MEEKQFITPHTTLAQLQKLFPEAYNFLIENVSYIRQINNENLLSVIAETLDIATISRYAEIPLHQLINKLREISGETIIEIDSSQKPEWVKPENIAKSLDARQIIMSGGHPLDQVIEEVAKLSKNEIFELITPFAPDPLIGVFQSQGCEVWLEQSSNSLFKTFIKK